MPRKTVAERAVTVASVLRTKLVSGFVDLKQAAKFTTPELVLGILALLNKQDTIIKDLEDRIRILERDKRHRG